MTALEKSAELPAYAMEAAPSTPRVYLLRGLVWLFSGIGLAIFPIGLAITANGGNSLERRLWWAQDLRQRGATADEVKSFIDHPDSEKPMPKGFALIGLIPIGAGIAYLIFYTAERRQSLAQGR